MVSGSFVCCSKGKEFTFHNFFFFFYLNIINIIFVLIQDCKSFRIGSSCCEFICLDNSEEGARDEGSIDVTWGDGTWVGGDIGLRLIATAVTAVLSLALLAFLFYRLRRRRVRSGSYICIPNV